MVSLWLWIAICFNNIITTKNHEIPTKKEKVLFRIKLFKVNKVWKFQSNFFLIQVYFDSLGNGILLESSYLKLDQYLESHDKIQRLI